MASIRRELKEYGLVPRKRWGQHFLVDRNILNKVVQSAQVNADDSVLEVGPGLGEMTLVLAHHAEKVIAVEIDPNLVEILKKKVKDQPNVEIVKADILKTDFSRLLRREGEKLKVVANLPYQISTPLIFRFLDWKGYFSTLTLMIQKEVAQRMVAIPGTKAYGPLSIFVQLFSTVSILFLIKPSAFFPPPKVESAVVQVAFRERPMVELLDPGWFKRVVKACFGYRRKTLINGLKHSGISLPEDLERRIEGIGIDPRTRPETLTIKELASLAEALKT